MQCVFYCYPFGEPVYEEIRNTAYDIIVQEIEYLVK